MNKVNRKYSVDNENVYYWLQMALVYARYMGCRTQVAVYMRRSYLQVISWMSSIRDARTYKLFRRRRV